MNEPEKKQEKWYTSNWALVVLFITIGPFAIPMVWASPLRGKKSKWILTLGMIAATVLITWAFGYFVQKILDYYKLLSEITV